MKTIDMRSRCSLTQALDASKLRRMGLSLTLTVMLLCGLTVSTSAQRPAVFETAPAQGFTITPHVQTPIILKTEPDAACDLHAEGISDPSHTLRFYANGDGYIQVHVTARQESEQGERVQLDCTAAGKVIRYPLHLRAASSPTVEMPAPQIIRPTPKGSRVLPALTEEDSQRLSDDDLSRLGYPRRPDARASRDKYAKWLERVSQPLTLVPSHVVNRSDISHQTRNVEAGTEANANWSGFEARGSNRSYMAVTGEWTVPEITTGESGNKTYSSFWVGLDGDGTSDLVQAGTEQDYVDIWIFNFAEYSAWTELLPNQPTEQNVSLSPNPGDDIEVEVWIGADNQGPPNQNGGYGNFRIIDWTQNEESLTATALSGTYFNGKEAEWIMERPTVNGTYAELSAYMVAIMTDASALPTKGPWIDSETVGNQELLMYNEDFNHPDNDLLSIPSPAGPDVMFFFWANFH